MTAGQKSAVTRKYNECRDIVNHPENYERISVSKKTAKIADWDVARKSTGKKVSLFIPKESNGHARISRSGVLPILILEYPDYIERVYPGGEKFFEVAEKVFKKEHDPRHWITARIGENASFKTARFDDRMALMNYLRNWEPKDISQRGRKHELIKHFSVVTLKYHKNPFLDNGRGKSNGKKKAGGKNRRRH